MDKIQTLLTIITSASIPSLVFGAIFNHWIKKQDARDAARVQAMVLLYQSDQANYCLAKECATAIQTDEHGENLQKAMDYAREVSHKQRDFVTGEAAKRHGKG